MDNITINYKNSGVKTLKAVSNVVLVFGIFIFAGFVVYSVIGDKPEHILTALIILLSSMFFSACGHCIATIAKSSLYQKEYIKAKAEKENIKIIDKTEKIK